MDFLTVPFQFAFMREAYLIAVMVGVPCALLSCFLVLKGWSLMGDAISHAVLPGVVAAYILNIPLIVGAFVAGMGCALLTGYLKENSRVKQDTVMGIVFSGMFGFGMVLYRKISTDVHLDHILFGNMLGIGMHDLWTAGLISLAVTAAILLRHRDLMLHAFDPVQARAVGLPVGLLHYGLLAMISMTIVATLSAVGIILAISLLIAPGAIAFLITKRFERMLATAVVVTLVAGFLGVYLSFYIDSAPAPTIVLLLTTVFVAAFVFSSVKARRAGQRAITG